MLAYYFEGDSTFNCFFEYFPCSPTTYMWAST